MPQGGRPVRVLLEGPFGSPAVDLLGERYRCVLLISGGIGITPCQALLNDLVAQAERGRPLRRLMMVWSVRDKSMVGRWVLGGHVALHCRHRVITGVGGLRLPLRGKRSVE
jgi:hypothetical protein